MIVEPVHRLDVCGVLVLLAERVIEVDVKDFGQTPCSGQLQQPRDLVVPEGVACFRGGPGTHFLARVQNLSRMPFFDSRGDVQRGLKITTALQDPLSGCTGGLPSALIKNKRLKLFHDPAAEFPAVAGGEL